MVAGFVVFSHFTLVIVSRHMAKLEDSSSASSFMSPEHGFIKPTLQNNDKAQVRAARLVASRHVGVIVSEWECPRLCEGSVIVLRLFPCHS